jgi:hypothetical protein
VNYLESHGPNIQATLLRAICACVLLGILVAGLWPFHAPRNEVSWLNEGDGLLFGKRGSIVSASPFEANGARADGSCSLEIWLEPSRLDLDAGGMILAFQLAGQQVRPVCIASMHWERYGCGA